MATCSARLNWASIVIVRNPGHGDHDRAHSSIRALDQALIYPTAHDTLLVPRVSRGHDTTFSDVPAHGSTHIR